MKQIAKKLFFWITIVLIALIVLLSATVLFLKTNAGRHFILDKVNSSIPGTITLEAVRFSLFRGTIKVEKFGLFGPEMKEIVALDSFYFDLDWWSLFKGDIRISRCAINRPRISVETNEAGDLNILKALSSNENRPQPPPPEPDRDGSPFNIVVDEFVIEHALVVFNQSETDLAMKAENVNLSVSGNLEQRKGEVALDLGPTRVISGAFDIELNRTKIAAILDRHILENLFISIVTPSSSIVLSGKIEDLFESSLSELDLSASVDVSEIGRFLKLQQQFSGTLQWNALCKGSLDNPLIRTSLHYEGGFLADQRVQSFQSELLLENRELTINEFTLISDTGSLDLQGKIGTRDVFPAGLLEAGWNLEKVRYSVKLACKNINLPALVKDLPVLAFLDADITVDGQGLAKADARLSLEMTARHVAEKSAEQSLDLRLSAEMSIGKNRAKLDMFKLSSRENKLEIEGFYDLGSQEFNLNTQARVPDLESVLAAVGIKGIRSSITLDSILTGTLKKPFGSLDLSARGLEYNQVKGGNFTIVAALDNSGKVTVSELSLLNGGSKLGGAGFVRLFRENTDLDPDLPVNFTLRLESVSPDDFMSGLPVKGVFDGILTLEGDLMAPRARLELSAQNSEVADLKTGDLELAMELENGILNISNATLKNGESRLGLTGGVKIFEGSVSGVLSEPILLESQLDITASLADFNENMAGHINASATVKGPIGDPSGVFNLFATEINLSGQKVDSLDLHGRIENKRVSFDPLQLSLQPEELIVARGWYSFDNTYNFELNSRGFSLERLVPLSDILEGRCVISLSGSGSIADPGLEGTVSIDHMRMKGQELGDFQMHLIIKDRIAHLTGNLDGAIEASYNLSTNDFRAELIFDRTDIASYLDITGLDHLDGRLSGSMTASGNTAHLESLNAALTINDLVLEYNAAKLLQSQKMVVKYEAETVSIDSFNLVFPDEGFLDVTGNIKMKDDLSVDLRGTIPLSVLSLFSGTFASRACTPCLNRISTK